VKRHAKASFAGSTQGSGLRRGLFGLVCLCVLGLAAFLGSGTPSAGAAQACPNEAFRTGFGAALPDCRAYEMVSPVDKNGADISTGPGIGDSVRSAYNQSAADGNQMTFSAQASFAEAVAGRGSNQYLATRGEDSWTTRAINAPLGPTFYESLLPSAFGTLETAFRLFTPDLTSAWIMDAQREPLLPEAIEDYPDVYRRDNVAGAYQALTKTAPTSSTEISEVDYELQGHSSDFSHVVFSVPAALTPDAAPITGPGGLKGRLYDSVGGELHFVSVLPDGTANPNLSVAGTTEQFKFEHEGSYHNAVSSDGSRIYWTSATFTGGPGTIYLRTNPDQPQSALASGECTEPEKACTVPVSTAEARFWSATPDGSKAIYSQGSPPEDLYEFDAATEMSTPIAGEVSGVLGASEDLSRIYFVSREDLAAGASAGEPNLYLDHGGTFVFIATVAATDSGTTTEPSTRFAPATIDSAEAIRHASRVSPDGRHVAFESIRSLTGYDNTDAVSGEPDMEVYLYDADSNHLSCVSCNPSGEPPVGQPLAPSYVIGQEPTNFEVGAAAWLQTLVHNLYASRALSLDGSRLFFNSFDALVPHDTNGAQDVYEWEAPGTGSCVEGGPGFSGQDDGCLSLISSGESQQKSEFVDATADGRNVFFETNSSLLPQDPGLIDLYDARVDGGFPQPQSPPACEGDACQGVPSAPPVTTPGSASFQGAGNLNSTRNCNKLGREAKTLTNRAKRLRKNAKRAKRAGNSRRAKQLDRKATRLAKRARQKSKSAKRCRKANRRAAR
jgi:WD40-like Beta Propeller Repeat